MIRSRQPLRAPTLSPAALLDAAPAALLGLDLDGDVCHWPKAAESLLGWSEAEALGRPLPGLADAARAELRRACLLAVSGELVQEWSGSANTRDGSPLRLRARVSLARENGRPAGFAVLLEREPPSGTVTAETPRGNGQDLRALISLLPASVAYVDAGQRYRVASGLHEEVYGLPRERIIGSHVKDVLGPNLYRQVEPFVLRALQGEAISFDFSTEPTQGRVRAFEVYLVPDVDAAGRVAGLFSLVFEVTDLRRPGGPQQFSRLRWETLVQHNPDSVLLLDRDFIIRYLNAVVPPFRMEEVIGVRALDFVAPSDRERVRGYYERSWATGETIDFEVPVLMGDRVAWHYVRVAAVRENGQTVCLMIVGRDITPLKRAEEERAAFQRNLHEARHLESLGVLAGGIAHDFNNLLTSVLCNVAFARQGLPDAAPTAECLREIETECGRAAELCRQMLAYAGEGCRVTDRLDLNRLLDDSRHLFRLSTPERVSLLVRPTVPLPSILADVVQVRQAVLNLVINASEALGPDGGEIVVSTAVQTVDETFRQPHGVAPGDYVVLEVADTGPGMTEDVRARIFEPFFSTKFIGRGLGLAAVQGILRSHQGFVTVDSRPGAGSRFRLFFPLLRVGP